MLAVMASALIDCPQWIDEGLPCKHDGVLFGLHALPAHW
jgi:hypothetical protein